MKTTRLISCAIICALFFSTTICQAKNFSDINELSPNYTAIKYLTDSGIINGYENGTFRPDNNINRVEFLKIVLLSSQITTDITTPTGFNDVNENAWYSPYLKKAKHEGWVQGYPDGSFKPDSPINKVEALKIIGEIQNWKISSATTTAPFDDTPTNTWYTPYIKYAKDKYFLEDPGAIFNPANLYSRGKISEVLFRSFITQKANAEQFHYRLIKEYPAEPISSTPGSKEPSPTTPPSENDAPTSKTPFTPVAHGVFAEDFFDNITLTGSFPNTFYVNEIYYFTGEITSGNYEEAFIFLAPDGVTDDKYYINYTGTVENGSFNIPVIFRESGNFKLGLILGKSGKSRVIDISVLETFPSPKATGENTSPPTNPSITFKNQTTTLSWTNGTHEIIKIHFIQGSKTQSFYSRQNIKTFNIPYREFEEFSEGTVNYTIQGAKASKTMPLEISTQWTGTPSQKFTASQHYFGENHPDKITVNNFPEIMNTRKKITFTGTAHEDIFLESAIIKPDGLVEIIELTTTEPTAEYYGGKYITQNGKFTFNYTPTENGIYMIEINGLDGSAVFNMPVYIENGIPLIPDYYDLHKNNEPIATVNLSADRTQLLNLINTEREKYGLSTLVLNNQLNNLAQAYSDDMIARNFFGHINPEGETPNDRRKKAGIDTKVGENLSIAPSIAFTHFGLMQSGIHRSNILNPEWTKLGIGISQDQYGSLYIAQEFSNNPHDENSLLTLKNNIIDQINQKRDSLNLSTLDEDTELTPVAEAWTQKLIDENFFGFTAPSGETLASKINKVVQYKPVQALILESNDAATLTNEILKGEEILDSRWYKIAIGILADSIGDLKVTLMLTGY